MAGRAATVLTAKVMLVLAVAWEMTSMGQGRG